MSKNIITTTTLAGTYGITALVHQDSPGDFLSFSGTLTLNSDGTYIATMPNGNSYLYPGNIPVTISGTYTVAENGEISFLNQFGETSTGFVGANGTGAAALTSTNASSEEIYVVSKLGSGMSGGEVAGSYGVVAYAHQDGPVENQVYSGTMTINANGTYSMAIANGNTDLNSLNIGGGAFTNTYTVAANGAVSMMTPWGSWTTGFIGANGTGATALTSANATSEEIWLATELGSGMTISDAVGVYGIVGYAHYDSPAENGSGSGILTLRADGTFVATRTYGNSDLSSVNSTDSGSGTFTVASNGALTLVDSSGERLTGFIGDDGTLIIALTSTNATSEEIYIGIPIGFTAGDDTVDGGFGDDLLEGGEGNDILSGGGGNDELIGGIGSDFLDGGTGDDDIKGGAGDDYLDGGSGADIMAGGAGNDVYAIDNVGDIVLETDNNPIVGSGLARSLDLGGTIDKVVARINYVLTDYVEDLDLLGVAAINATGNGLDNILTGNAAVNTLNGMAGADTMIGGDGADTYVVDDAGDRIIETNSLAAGGSDLVQSALSYTLGDNLERLTLTDSAINGTGNALANLLTGNAANNRLDGGAGADTLAGGLGHDLFIVDSPGDVVTELAEGGTDTVLVSTTLAAGNFILGANVEYGTLAGADNLNLAGNGSNNGLLGNHGANILDGGIGNDALQGGGGNDTLLGGAGNDSLAGRQGSDRMEGGAGNDSYYVNRGDGAGTAIDANEDTVVELAGAGTDTVYSSVYTYSLDANVENLVLQAGKLARKGFGNAADNAITGNGLNNTISGEGGNDTLAGGAGNDTLSGGAGIDSFVFATTLDAATNSDKITDFVSGTDKILLSASIFDTLGAAGVLNAGYFNAGTGAQDANDHIIFNVTTGALYYDPDGTGVVDQVQFAILGGVSVVAATDFVVGI